VSKTSLRDKWLPTKSRYGGSISDANHPGISTASKLTMRLLKKLAGSEAQR
jgi:hypothetical protein